MDIQQKQQKQQKQDGFTIVSTDESFFFYDYLVRRVWIKQDKRPVVRVTGSHQHSCIFGANALRGESNYSDSMINSMAPTLLGSHMQQIIFYCKHHSFPHMIIYMYIL